MKKSLLIFVLAALLLPLAAYGQDESDVVWSMYLPPATGWPLRNALFSPDGSRVFITNKDGNTFVLDTETGSQLHIIENAGDVVAFSPDGQFIYTKGIYKLDAETYEPIGKIQQFGVEYYQIFDLDVTDDGSYLLIVGNDMTPTPDQKNNAIAIVNANTMELIKHLDYPGEMSKLALSPTGQYFVTNWSDGIWNSQSKESKLLLWDAQKFEMIKVLETWENRYLNDITFSPSGEYLSMCMGNKVKIYEIPEGSLIFEAEVPKISINTSAFSKDNSYLFIGTGAPPWKIFNIATQELSYEFPYKEGYGGIRACDVSPDNNLIIASSSRHAYLLNAKWDPSSIDKDDNELQIKAYPVPSESGLILEYYLPKPGETKIFLIDTKGYENLLFEGFRDKGKNEHRINTAEYPSGTYTLLIEYNDGLYSKKIIISK